MLMYGIHHLSYSNDLHITYNIITPITAKMLLQGYLVVTTIKK